MTRLSRTMIVCAIVVAFGVIASTASAGWAGSVYKRSECTYDATSNLLFCYTENLAITEPSTRNVSIEDASCESGYRLFERSGRFTQTYHNYYDWYLGTLPKAENNVGGDDNPGDSYWEPNYRDKDLGCFVP
jgi:hypothetical protein